MNKILTFLLLASVSANGQTLTSASPNPMTFAGLLNSVSSTPSFTITGSPNTILMDTALMNAMKAASDTHNKAQQFKPVFSDYVVLPNRKGGNFEILDHEATKIDGSIVDLTKYVLSNAYSNKIPAGPNNGAIKIQHAIYEETITGTGNIPWFTTVAPEPGGRTSLQINTYANLMLTNYNGAYQINTPDGNSLELATTAAGGQVGWTKVDSTSKLFLGANYVSLPGHLEVKGLITAATGLSVGDSKTSTLNMSSTTISFISSYSNLAPNNDNHWKDAFVLTANGADGIIVNSLSTMDGHGGMIRFATNSQVMASFTTNGIVVGEGFPGSSAVLTLRSTNKGFMPPKMSNTQIFAINNPEEGTEVYSLDEHAPIFYNGTNWIQPSHFKVLQRLYSPAN
ncbi:MAG: hypothetical protein JWR09_5540 [Mucilaginibacter sp.]|nr:hypothetical protein [Mucilaginibacter sp.]